MVNIPSGDRSLGEEFEYESQVSKQELITFLEELANQLKNEDEVTVSFIGAQASFPFEEPIYLEVDCDYVKGGNRELEIEFEFKEKRSN